MNADPFSSFPRLIGDVGGTNARFAIQLSAAASPSQVATFACADYESFEAVVRQYLTQLSGTRPRYGAVGIANPVVEDHVQMTNFHWSFSIEAMRRSLDFERFLVLNDFTALALSLPGLTPPDLRQVGSGRPQAGAALGLIGPGTGLGVSGLLRTGDGRGWLPLKGEGGHVSLAPATAREDAVITILRQRFGHASAERALSGSGLVNLYEALCQIDGTPAQRFDPAGMSAAALAGIESQCVEAVEIFFALLGATAGNLALTLGARGGLYIGGGVVPRLGDWIERSLFRARFVDKGRFSAYLEPIPTYLIQAATPPALLGAARALDEL